MKKALIMVHAIKRSQLREHKVSVITALFNSSRFIFSKRKKKKTKKYVTKNGEVEEGHPKTAEKHVTYLPSLKVLA